MARKAYRSEDELRRIFADAGLRMAEAYDPARSYPKNGYLLAECESCHTRAHYRLDYIMKSSYPDEPTCGVCRWRKWYRSSEGLREDRLTSFISDAADQLEADGDRVTALVLREADPHLLLEEFLRQSISRDDDESASFYKSFLPPDPITPEGAKSLAEKNGYDLVELIDADRPGCEIMLVRCRACGRQTAKRPSDVEWGCSCRSHPNTPSLYAPGESHLLCDSEEPCLGWWAHDLNDEGLFRTVKTHARKDAMWRCPECGATFQKRVFEMTGPSGPSCPSCAEARRAAFHSDVERYKRTPCSDVPELLEAWDDARDPSQIMVWHTGWSGMSPGDGQVRFKCRNGHHPNAFPYTYLTRGCPFCRAQETSGGVGYIRDASPELAAEWSADRNGRWTPSNVRLSSKRMIWWHCLGCGHEWQETPRNRSKVRHSCPECGKILGSLAWTYPTLAEEWDPSNPLSPWQVRPRANTRFKPKWVCHNDQGHRWQATLASRTGGGGCPQCRESGKSQVELAHFEAALAAFGNARSGVKLEDPTYSHAWTVDISVAYLGRRVVIEYDGAHWHAEKAEQDTRKSKELLAAGHTVIRLREDELPSLGIEDPNYMEVRVSSQAARPKEVMREIRETLDSLWLG